MFKLRGTFATLSENPLGVGQDNQAALIGLVHFLLPIQSAAIMNEISKSLTAYDCLDTGS